MVAVQGHGRDRQPAILHVGHLLEIPAREGLSQAPEDEHAARRHRDRIPAGVTGHAVVQCRGSDPLAWSLVGSGVLLLPGVAFVGYLGVGHSDREAQRPEDLPACRDHPRRAHHRGNRDHDSLDIVGGDPAVLGGTGVGEVGGAQGPKVVDRRRRRMLAACNVFSLTLGKR